MMMDNNHGLLMLYAVGWTIVGVFIGAAIKTLFELFRHSLSARERRVLFRSLIVQVVVVCVSAFASFIKLSPTATVERIEQPLKTELKAAQIAASLRAHEGLKTIAASKLREEFPEEKFDEVLFLGFVTVEPKSTFDLDISPAMKECVYVQYIEGADAVFIPDGGRANAKPITVDNSPFLVNEKVLIENPNQRKAVCFVAVWSTHIPHN